MGKNASLEIRLQPHSDAEQGAARLAWAIEQVPAGARVARVVQPIPALDALRWLASRPEDLLVHWQTRDGAFRLAGAGSAAGDVGAAAPDVLRLLRELATDALFDSLRILAWGRADPTLPTSPAWAPFGAIQSLLPLVEYREEAGLATLSVHLVRPEFDPQGHAMNAQIRRAQRILTTALGPRVVPPGGAEPGTEVPDDTTLHLRAAQGTAHTKRRGVKRFSLLRARHHVLAAPVSPVAWLAAGDRHGETAYRILLQVGPQHALVMRGAELLYRRQGDELLAEVVSGMMRRGGSLKSDARQGDALLESAPHVLEHEVLRLDLQQRLAQAGAGSLRHQGPRVFAERGLLRLRSTLSGRLEPGTGDGPPLALLQPPAGTSGLPLAAARELSASLDATDPGLLGGFVGCFGRRESEVAQIVPALLQTGSQVQISLPCPVTEGVLPAVAWKDSAARLDSMEADLGLVACDRSAKNPTSTAFGAA